MPPNILMKAAFVRGGLESAENLGYERQDMIRTDFVLQNIFSYSLRRAYPFDVVLAMNDKEDYVLKELKETYDAFLSTYGDNIKCLCSEIEVTQDTIGSVLQGVSNELFCEGITWSRIIALFAFIGELTLLCLARKFPSTMVHGIYECFCRLVKDKLKPWVDDHGGWEGLATLSITQQENTNSLEQPKSSNSSWALSILHKTVQVIGTIAQFANSTSHALP